jgi:hypothetical protein
MCIIHFLLWLLVPKPVGGAKTRGKSHDFLYHYFNEIVTFEMTKSRDFITLYNYCFSQTNHCKEMKNVNHYWRIICKLLIKINHVKISHYIRMDISIMGIFHSEVGILSWYGGIFLHSMSCLLNLIATIDTN